MNWLKDRLSKAKEWNIEQWDAFIRIQKDWIATYEKRVFLILVAFILVVLILWLAPKWQVHSYRARFDSLGLGNPERIQLEKDLITAENNARVTIAQTIGGLLVLLGLYATFRNLEIARENLRVAEEGKLTERFSKAVELLGSDKLDIRLGGIYALERIARDSLKDHWTVMEVLTAFVREQSRKEYRGCIPGLSEPSSSIDIIEDDLTLREDIQAALTVIGRREWSKVERPHQELNLMQAYLGKVFLYDANLRNANLFKTNLQQSILFRTDLRKAILADAILIGADLNYAKLNGTNLQFALLHRADLRTSTGLSWEQISKAVITDETMLPPELEERRKAERVKKAAAQNQ
ncbi:MAG TPA: pentapeptide repeat-containing protein [Blastocatellia bacterium]|nr:pentapeptide repeat-containing protein [Blastocatellia bacterium]